MKLCGAYTTIISSDKLPIYQGITCPDVSLATGSLAIMTRSSIFCRTTVLPFSAHK